MNLLGEPTCGTTIDGSYFEGGAYFGYSDILFILDYETHNSTIVYIVTNPKYLNVNGKSLDLIPSDLIDLLGEPSYAENYYDEMEEIYTYVIKYSCYEYGVTLTFMSS